MNDVMKIKNKFKRIKSKVKDCFKLPNRLIRDRIISYSTKKVCAVIYSFANLNQNKAVMISARRIAKILGSRQDLVYAAINELERHNYIKRQSNRICRNGKILKAANIYICCESLSADFTFVPRKSLQHKCKTTYAGYAVYLYLLSEGHLLGRAFPSLSEIQEKTSASRSTIIRTIKCLDKVNLIGKQTCKTKQGCYTSTSYIIVRFDSRVLKKNTTGKSTLQANNHGFMLTQTCQFFKLLG